MRAFAALFFSGILIVVLLALFMNFVSLHMSYVMIIATLLLLLVSIVHQHNSIHYIWKIVLLAGPTSAAFYFLVVNELPSLWIAIPLFILTVVVGLMPLKKIQKWVFVLAVFLLSVSLSMFQVPDMISNDLGVTMQQPAAKFEFRSLLDGTPITNASLKQKVVVLDFFGTWCAPCILEMEELEAIRKEFSTQESQIEFIIVCTEEGKDTPEKALLFHKKRGLSFDLAFDSGSEVHRSFGFTGVPALLVLDKKGTVRFTHEGYNQAENLKETLIPLLSKLLQE